MTTTVTWLTAAGELQRGHAEQHTTSVTTDHATGGPAIPPPGPPPSRAPRGGGDDHLPNRRQVLAERALLAGTVLLTALTLAHALASVYGHARTLA